MYTFDSRIRYSETDQDGRLSVPALINYFQDCSTFQSEHLGVGFSHLKKKDRAWFLAFWQIEVKEYPKMLTPVTVGTAPWQFKSFLGMRNFAMFPQGDVSALSAAERMERAYVCANSVWVFMDTVSGRPVRPEPEDFLPYGQEEPFPMEYRDRKIRVPAGEQPQPAVRVTPDMIDTNGHVNNGKYIQIAMEQMEPGFRPHRLCAAYQKAARLGDVMVPCIVRENGETFVALRAEDGTPWATVVFG